MRKGGENIHVSLLDILIWEPTHIWEYTNILILSNVLEYIFLYVSS